MSATRHVFDNGLTLLVEPLAQVRSVAIGVSAKTGNAIARKSAELPHSALMRIAHSCLLWPSLL